MNKLLFLLLGSLSFSKQVLATPIQYIESGNEFEEAFLGFDGANRLFTLDIGMNSISGTQQLGDSLADVFGFIVQEGQIVTSATFNILSFAGYEGNTAVASIGADPNVWGNYLGTSESLKAGESSSFSVHSYSYLNLPLEAGDYAAFCCGGGYLSTANGYDLPVFTYRFDFDVAAAPVVTQPAATVSAPSVLALFGLGLAAAGLSRRRKIGLQN